MTRTGSRAIKLLAAALVAGVVMLPAADALARAGGGSSGGYSGGSRSSGSSSFSSSSSRSSGYGRSGSSSGGGLASLIPLGFVGLFFMALVAGGSKQIPARQRANEADDKNREVLKRIARLDDVWSPAHMNQRVEEVFHKVQQAWTERHQEICRDYVSPRLYANHKAQTDAMIQAGHRNVLEEITLLDCDIIHIADRKGTRDDEFWAVVTGRMVDYLVAVGREREVEKPGPTEFQEVWKFVREDHGWVLDRIDQDISAHLNRGRVISDEVAV